ncbi:MAG: hypothetical protein Q7J34_03395 [Bacteroidales bacterium]|nr:hypothetical protein [Bacteroidales bacterium]
MKRNTFHTVFFHIAARDVMAETAYFSSLGFEPLNSPMDGLTVISDGALRLSIGPENGISTGILLAGEKMEDMKLAVAQSGYQPSDGMFPMLSGPSGTHVTLIELPAFSCQAIGGKPIGLLGTFFEISVETKNHEATVEYWEKLGFEIIYGERDGNWVTLADDFMKIGFYRKDTVGHPFRSPAITYFEKDMKDRINLIKTLDIPVSYEVEACGDSASDAILETPSGNHIFAFTA